MHEIKKPLNMKVRIFSLLSNSMQICCELFLEKLIEKFPIKKLKVYFFHAFSDFRYNNIFP